MCLEFNFAMRSNQDLHWSKGSFVFNLGLSEIILISVIALIFIGPKQLPEIARALGRALNELKRASEDLSSTIINPKNFINNKDEHTNPSSHGGYEGHEAYESSESLESSENRKEDLTKASQTDDDNTGENKKADT